MAPIILQNFTFIFQMKRDLGQKKTDTNTDHDAQWRNVINEVLLLLWLLCKSCCNIFYYFL